MAKNFSISDAVKHRYREMLLSTFFAPLFWGPLLVLNFVSAGPWRTALTALMFLSAIFLILSSRKLFNVNSIIKNNPLAKEALHDEAHAMYALKTALITLAAVVLVVFGCFVADMFVDVPMFVVMVLVILGGDLAYHISWLCFHKE